MQAFIYTRLSAVFNAHLFLKQMLVDLATYTHIYSSLDIHLNRSLLIYRIQALVMIS